MKNLCESLYSLSVYTRFIELFGYHIIYDKKIMFKRLLPANRSDQMKQACLKSCIFY